MKTLFSTTPFLSDTQLKACQFLHRFEETAT